ncbi:unnamed protein product [Echinostoma caproni]|uniref:UBC core domain-containing protein n=1 Tax=Echinostoma caproni TaxID=27848 RepID=A0A183B5H0_9TREM|nr:unnamed protein product [Echinostoma caproni]
MSAHTSSDSSSNFEWDEYLVKTNGKPADPKCFKQSLVPPENRFEVNTLLEAEDQRSAALDVQTAPSFSIDPNKTRTSSGLAGSTSGSGAPSGAANAGLGSGAGRRTSLMSSHHPLGTLRRFRAAAFSLARVIEVWGARLRIRLVGTDDRNDCWFLVDSDQIRPYPSGNPLQPPFGYIHNHLVWNRTLKRATEGAKFADSSWFIEVYMEKAFPAVIIRKHLLEYFLSLIEDEQHSMKSEVYILMGMHPVKKAWVFVHPHLLIHAIIKAEFKHTLNQPLM